MSQPKEIRNDFLFDLISKDDKNFISGLADENKKFFIAIFHSSRQAFKSLYKEQQDSFFLYCAEVQDYPDIPKDHDLLVQKYPEYASVFEAVKKVHQIPLN